MAKGLRASSKKSNKTLLRARVFGPVIQERSARLAEKVRKIVEAQPVNNEKTKSSDLAKSDTEDMMVDSSEKQVLEDTSASTMDLDAGKPTTTTPSSKLKTRIRKGKKSIVFPVGRKHRPKQSSKRS